MGTIDKDMELQSHIEAYTNNFRPIEIPENTNFWLVRTKRGHFYNDFYLKRFIALGWNLIDRSRLYSVEEDYLKEEISKNYKDNKRPGYPLNQSRTFIEEMKENDFVIIPAVDDKPVMFGQLVQYYEENDLTYQDEINFLNDLPPAGEPADCPYKKRWKVKWIKSRRPEELNPHLNRLFASSHGLSKANDYSDYILSSVFDFYKWQDSFNGVFRVKQRRRIRSRDLSGFIYNMDKLSELTIGAETSVKSNLNSPGDIILSIGDTLTNIDDIGRFFWIAFFLASDIDIGPFTIKGILPFIVQMVNNHQSKEQQNAEIEKKRAETRLLDAISEKVKAETKKINSETRRAEDTDGTAHIAFECQECARQLEIEANTMLQSNLINPDGSDNEEDLS